MKILTLLCVVFVSTFQAKAQQSQGDFWLLRTDHRTSDALTTVISTNKLEPDALSERITQLIKQRKITELAKFNQQLGGGKIKMEKPDGEIKIREVNETIPMGITIDTEATFMEDMQACDMVIQAEIYEKQKTPNYYYKNIQTGITILNNDWQLLHHWKNETECTLLLARFAALPKRIKKEQLPDRSVSTEVELLQVSQFDLDKFKKSTPATRSKAVAWLKDRSKRLASTTIFTRSGEKSLHQDHLIYNSRSNNWNMIYLGFLFEIEAVLGQGKVDLKVNAEWQNPNKVREKPEYKFTFAKMVPINQPLLIEPTTKPDRKDDPLILILTPNTKSPAGSSKPKPVKAVDPTRLPDGIFTGTYPVKPSFYRLLNAKHPDKLRQPLKKLLQLEGIRFPDKTSAVYVASTSTVVIRHNKSGHLAFQEILKKLSGQK